MGAGVAWQSRAACPRARGGRQLPQGRV